ncbi:hypothetical protein Bpfe_005997 [Biomphalaria pfeifferi]|uniref:Uncharacterized protein n=1 Tax=Biomphalaria pfeifferi TaxID=112525 RepID=A0AAD8FHQ5_BIOPF|nr:hypothetical protein Bpfe_005997 [Biomphalaria pfeifferi]
MHLHKGTRQYLLDLTKTPDSILNYDAVTKGDIAINVLVHTVSSDAASPEIFAGYPKLSCSLQANQQRGKKWKMYDRDIITNDVGNKIKALR